MSKPNDRDEALQAASGCAQASRRGFLKTAGAVTVGAAALTTPSTAMALSWEEFFQKHYKRMTDEDKKVVFARLEAETKKKYHVDVNITDPMSVEGVEFGYALNLSYCVGCRRCEYACEEENNTSRSPQVHYIRVLEIEKGTLDLERSNTTYEGKVPKKDKFYMPVQCHHCSNPPCVKACPIKATWSEPDGLVVVDYNWCIGCRFCEAACPYFARRFNWTEPTIDADDINLEQGYLSNRIRPQGVMEKCTFCLHRTREGLYPACLEACPTGARKFGNMLDPESEVRKVIETKRVYVLKEDVGTIPRFYYFFD